MKICLLHDNYNPFKNSRIEMQQDLHLDQTENEILHIEELGATYEITTAPALEDFHMESCAPPPAYFSKTCRQTFTICFYCFSSISITLYNKWLLNQFHFPISMILFHFTTNAISSWTLIYLFFYDKYSLLPDWITKITKDKFIKLVLPIASLFTLDIVGTQFGLMLSSVTLAEIVKSSVPVMVFFFTITMGIELFTYKKFIIMGMISIGISLTTLGETNLQFWALIFFMGASVAAASKLVYVENLVGDKHMGLPTLLALAYISTTGIPFLLLGSITVEWSRLFQSEFVKDHTEGGELFGYLCGGAVFAFLLNLSEIMLIGATSAVTTCVVGIAKMLVAILLAQGIFGFDLNSVNVTGIVITMLGIAGYNYNKFQEKKAKKRIPYVKQNDLPEFELGEDIPSSTTLEEGTAI